MRWWLHIIFWIGIWFWMTTVYLYSDEDFVPFLLINLVRLPVFMGATYGVAYFVIKKQVLSSPPDYLKATLIFVLIFITASAIDRFINGNPWLVPTLNGMPLHYTFFYVIPIAKNGFLLISVIAIGSAIQFFRISSAQNQEIHLLKEEKLESELAFLKNQLNPHFLFNTFNNLYSMANQKGYHDLASGLEAISGLMRYLTYESNLPKVALEKEITLIESFLELQKLRLGGDGDLSISFHVKGEVYGKMIAPVLLLPLIENAFKHGYAPGLSSWITILLSLKGDELELEVKNKKTKSSSTNGGIGLTNLRKRLALVYPGKHSLLITEDSEVYKVILTLTITQISHQNSHG